MRPDGRKPDELRPIKIKRRFTRSAPGSVFIQAGRTTVLCTADVTDEVPPWMRGEGRGWVTAEYGMLPGSTSPRKQRDRGAKTDGRTTEIQRLIGRSLRAVVDLDALGERTVAVDCDVLEADGGTRTLSITGALIALVDALHAKKLLRVSPLPLAGTTQWSGLGVRAKSGENLSVRSILKDSVAAVSVGLIEGRAVLDLDYREDVAADVDMNVVMTGGGRYVEVQGTGEEATFSDRELTSLLSLARTGIERLAALQKEALGKHWPFAD